ncbi:RNA-binding protein 25, partial [Ophiophagus hannah]
MPQTWGWGVGEGERVAAQQPFLLLGANRSSKNYNTHGHPFSTLTAKPCHYPPLVPIAEIGFYPAIFVFTEENWLESEKEANFLPVSAGTLSTHLHMFWGNNSDSLLCVRACVRYSVLGKHEQRAKILMFFRPADVGGDTAVCVGCSSQSTTLCNSTRKLVRCTSPLRLPENDKTPSSADVFPSSLRVSNSMVQSYNHFSHLRPLQHPRGGVIDLWKPVSPGSRGPLLRPSNKQSQMGKPVFLNNWVTNLTPVVIHLTDAARKGVKWGETHVANFSLSGIIHLGLNCGGERERDRDRKRERETRERERERETYRHTHRHNTERQTQRQRGRHREGDTETERDTHTHTQQHRERDRERHTQRETQRKRQRERQRDTQGERKTERERHRDTQRHRERHTETEMFPVNLLWEGGQGEPSKIT